MSYILGNNYFSFSFYGLWNLIYVMPRELLPFSQAILKTCLCRIWPYSRRGL